LLESAFNAVQKHSEQYRHRATGDLRGASVVGSSLPLLTHSGTGRALFGERRYWTEQGHSIEQSKVVQSTKMMRALKGGNHCLKLNAIHVTDGGNEKAGITDAIIIDERAAML
jgi:hypothetical protein